MSITHIPVVGDFKYRDYATQPAAGGVVYFEAVSPAIVDGVVITLPTQLQTALDSAGQVPAGMTLPTVPGGVYYRVVESFKGGRPAYIIAVLPTDTLIDLATVATVVPADTYIGSGVASVNGQTGVAVLTAADVGADLAGAAATAQSAAIAAAIAASATAAQGTKADAAQVGIQFEDEGLNVGALGAVTAINFTGAGVATSIIGTSMTIAVTGGAAGQPIAVAVPAGEASANTGITVTGGGGAYGGDKGMVFDMTSGSLSAIDIMPAGTGSQMRFFEADGHVGSYISDGNAWITAKWIGIYAGIYTTSGVPGDANYNRTYHPPMQAPHMFGIHADVQLAAVIRGANLAHLDQQAVLYMANDGNGYRLDMANGRILWPRPDQPVFIGDINNAPALAAIPTASFPIELNAFNGGGLYGLRLRSTNAGVIGSGWWFIESNGGIAGDNGKVLLQYESGVHLRWGNSTQNQTFNGISQTVFEISGANVAWLTATGFHPVADYGKDLGEAGDRWNYVHAKYVRTHPLTVAALAAAATAGAGARAFVSDATATTFASVAAGGGANGVPVYSDGTSWRVG